MHYIYPKIILQGQEALLKAFNGIDLMAKTVGATMGSHGRMILIDRGRFNSPTFTRDGVSVAKEIGVSDPVEKTAIAVLFEASRRTNEEAGDGTTNAIILAHAMIEEGIKHVLARRNVIRLASGMLKAVSVILDKMKEVTEQIEYGEELQQVATISSQDADIGRVIAQVMEKVGSEGSIITDVKPGSPGIEWGLLEGMRFDRGYYSPHFVTDFQRVEYNEQGVYILICGDVLSSGSQMKPIFDAMVKHNKEEGKGTPNCLIIAPNFRDDGLKFFVQNKEIGVINPVLVRAPTNTDMRGLLEDLAIATGAKFHYSEDGTPLPNDAAKANISSWGFAERVVVNAEETAIIGGMGEKENVKKRAELLRGLQKNEEDTFKKEQIGERISRLTSGVGIVRVSAKTEAQTEELRYRVEDALCAAKASLSEGTVPGGGVALLRASQLALADKAMDFIDDDERAGAMIVLSAIRKPAWQIATNAGESGDVVVHEILKRGEEEDALDVGYNLITRRYEDLREAGVIDPAKAIRCALENAVGVASSILTMDGIVVHEKEPDVMLKR